MQSGDGIESRSIEAILDTLTQSYPDMKSNPPRRADKGATRRVHMFATLTKGYDYKTLFSKLNGFCGNRFTDLESLFACYIFEGAMKNPPDSEHITSFVEVLAYFHPGYQGLYIEPGDLRRERLYELVEAKAKELAEKNPNTPEAANYLDIASKLKKSASRPINIKQPEQASSQNAPSKDYISDAKNALVKADYVSAEYQYGRNAPILRTFIDLLIDKGYVKKSDNGIITTNNEGLKKLNNIKYHDLVVAAPMSEENKNNHINKMVVTWRTEHPSTVDAASIRTISESLWRKEYKVTLKGKVTVKLNESDVERFLEKLLSDNPSVNDIQLTYEFKAHQKYRTINDLFKEISGYIEANNVEISNSLMVSLFNRVKRDEKEISALWKQAQTNPNTQPLAETPIDVDDGYVMVEPDLELPSTVPSWDKDLSDLELVEYGDSATNPTVTNSDPIQLSSSATSSPMILNPVILNTLSNNPFPQPVSGKESKKEDKKAIELKTTKK